MNSEREAVILLDVSDGDTIVVKWRGQRERVRLLLIDAPEMNYTRKGPQPDPYALEAKVFVENELLLASCVELELDSQERDRHGRLLAHLFADGKNINLALLEQGLARYAFDYGHYKYEKAYRAAEKRAKKRKQNIWSKSNYVTKRGFHNPKTKRIFGA